MYDDNVIEARDLTKRFGTFTAVDGIDFEVRRGECFGFLGPNGAGKTTTIRMISCVSPVTSGTLRVLGMDPARDARRIKARLGVVPQEDHLDPDLTVLENLLAYARYFDIPPAEARRRALESLEIMTLATRAGEQIGNLSGGMRRRLTVARALISRPELMILDEPTTGLDPQARHLLWQRLRALKRQGLTMLLTTHYMEEAAQLCDRLVIMDDSRIIARGTPGELIERYAGHDVIEVRLKPEMLAAGLERVHALVDGTAEIEMAAEVVYLYARDGGPAALLDRESMADVAEDVIRRRASLEDVFLRLTGRDLIE